MPSKGYRKPNAKKRSIRQRKYNSQTEQKKRRAARNKIRRASNRSGRTSKGDGKDIDHLDRRTLNPKKTMVTSKSKNRAKNSPLKRRKRR